MKTDLRWYRIVAEKPAHTLPFARFYKEAVEEGRSPS